MDEELVFGERFGGGEIVFGAGWVENLLRARLECRFEL